MSRFRTFRALPVAAVFAVAGVSVPRAEQASAAPAHVQQQAPQQQQSEAQTTADAFPFGVGERLTYEVRFGPLKVGNGSMEITGVEDIRGTPTYHAQFRVKGGTFFYKVDDAFDSWMDVRTLNSLRFVQDQSEGRHEREKRYEIYPERAAYVEEGKAEKASVTQPLDDASFLYFVRTIPLVIGQTYDLNRYFRPEKNPVRLKVVRRERISVPAGTFDAVVVQPIIKTSGIFGENGHAEVWLSDDSRRMMLQMKSQLKFGSLNLYLSGARPGAPAVAR